MVWKFFKAIGELQHFKPAFLNTSLLASYS